MIKLVLRSDYFPAFNCCENVRQHSSSTLVVHFEIYLGFCPRETFFGIPSRCYLLYVFWFFLASWFAVLGDGSSQNATFFKRGNVHYVTSLVLKTKLSFLIVGLLSKITKAPTKRATFVNCSSMGSEHFF